MEKKEFRKDMTPEQYKAYLARAKTPENNRQRERSKIPWDTRFKSKKKVG